MPNQLQYTPIGQIPEIHAHLKATFDSGVTRPLAYRRKQLLQLARLLQENVEAIENAMLEDLGKPRQEVTMIEIGGPLRSAIQAAEELEEWTKPEKVKVEEWRSFWDTTSYPVPKGVALIISPWNYPFILTFDPLVGALAAGCTALLKPSESTPACSALMASLVSKYLDPNAVVVVNGAVKETTAVLDLHWDHIFYTGGTKVGKVIAAAAAKFVTPVTLELGGKSPVIIDPSCDLELAARRVFYGKFQNAGQLCVAPDYVLVPKSIMKDFQEAIKKTYQQFWPKTTLHPDAQWGKLVNPHHHARVKNLIDRTKGEIILGGEVDGDRRIALTVVRNVEQADSLMEEENFGPVLPLLEVADVDEAISIIASRPPPLVVYAFTNSEETKEKILEKTRSGSISLNDTLSLLGVHELPFGGVGESGYGKYFGKATFDVFTHQRGFINVPKEMEPHLAFRYPPYSEESYNIVLGRVTGMKIPDA